MTLTRCRWQAAPSTMRINASRLAAHQGSEDHVPAEQATMGELRRPSRLEEVFQK